jgi:hypothetical protein
MNTLNLKYVTDQMQNMYNCIINQFMNNHFLKEIPDELFHYTGFSGLQGILSSGKIYSTQVSCLNDQSEFSYFSSKVINELDRRLSLESNERVVKLFQCAKERLSRREYHSVGAFISCLSSKSDDLNQWRSYGGGECGYAIGFSTKEMMIPIFDRQGILLDVLYDEKLQQIIIDEMLHRLRSDYILLTSSDPDLDLNKLNELLDYVGWISDPLSVMIKNPLFSDEAEWRIAIKFLDGDHKKMEFRQKNTLLARHLPLDYWVDEFGKCKLPITSIRVGPIANRSISRIAVENLLLKYDYNPNKIKVTVSEVPYRNP